MFVCNSCPRKCNIDRDSVTGICGAPAAYKVARAALHFWEEPCISGEKGSGTVFFSGCSLKCVFCQNFEISRNAFGKEISEEKLIEIFKDLENQGAHNINLVNPTHYSAQLSETLRKYKSSIPVVWNTGGYDSVESLRKLDGLVDIYLADIKYVSESVSKKYSGAENYFSVASQAVLEMQSQVGENVFDENGIMKKGLIIRHLVLPGNVSQAFRVMDWVKENLPEDTILSLMSQYTPCGKACEYPTINRRLSEREYDLVLDYAEKLDFENVFIQEIESSSKDFIPDFDLTGI
ncbi:MAG: radical SAM protein [Acutalibacteraceae bacterium]|nr:radical SAM protein [Acutalibacteraceae bacterium]